MRNRVGIGKTIRLGEGESHGLSKFENRRLRDDSEPSRGGSSKGFEVLRRNSPLSNRHEINVTIPALITPMVQVLLRPYPRRQAAERPPGVFLEAFFMADGDAATKRWVRHLSFDSVTCAPVAKGQVPE